MIGIVAPFDPLSVVDYISDRTNFINYHINNSASSINNLVLSLLNAGENVCVFTLDHYSSDIKKYKTHNLIIYTIGIYSKNCVLKYFPNITRLAKVISNSIELEINQISVLHAHWCYEYAMAASYYVDRVPVVCTIRDWAPYIFNSIPLYPIHICILQKIYWAYKIRIAKKVFSKDSITFVSNSEYTKSVFESSYPNKCDILIPNSIDSGLILDVYPLKKRPRVFISIATSLDDKRKNIITLIKAFIIFEKKYTDSQLLLVGNIHKDRELYKKIMAENRFGNIRLLGVLDRDTLFQYIDESTCLIHPALEETFGNILLEGMARRIPVIGGEKSGAIPFVLDNGKCGCLCNIASPIAICEAMEKVSFDTEYSNYIVKNATDRLLSEYSNEVVAQKHIVLYNKLKR